MDSEAGISRRFPSYSNAYTYVLRDRALRHRSPATGPLTRFAGQSVAELMPVYVGDHHGTDIQILDASFDRFCLGTMLQGRMVLHLDGKETDVVAEGCKGLIYRSAPGIRFQTDDDNARFNLWIDAARVEQTLDSMLDGKLRQRLTFAPAVDWSTGLAATLRGLLRLFAAELERADGIAAHPIALRSFTDLMVQTMLQGLPHSHSDRLQERKTDPVPRHLRKAEEYMRSHADEAISMQEVAQAAGCSLRSLYDAFSRWRDTTPLAMLHRVRLDMVHAELSRLGAEATPQSVTGLARRFGFTNRSRFLSAYTQRFGELPAGARRRR